MPIIFLLTSSKTLPHVSRLVQKLNVGRTNCLSILPHGGHAVMDLSYSTWDGGSSLLSRALGLDSRASDSGFGVQGLGAGIRAYRARPRNAC